MPKCRARTERNTLCRNPVAKAGQRCHKHRGLPEAGPPKAKQPRHRQRAGRELRIHLSNAPTHNASEQLARNRAAERQRARRTRRQARVEEAAKFCADVLTSRWQEQVASRASDYITERTWKRLFRGHRRKRCKALADLANKVLAGKKRLHALVGWTAQGVASLVGLGKIEQKLVSELAARITLPPDAKLVAVARSIQVTGILLCLMDGGDLDKCQCFIELALEETKTRVKQILSAALDDWTHLAAFPRVAAHGKA